MSKKTMLTETGILMAKSLLISNSTSLILASILLGICLNSGQVFASILAVAFIATTIYLLIIHYRLKKSLES